MNSEVKKYQMENQSKGNLYLGLLIIALLLFVFSASLLLFVVAVPLKQITHLSLQDLSEVLIIFEKYYDTSVKDLSGITWAEYAQNYFANDPVMFENIRTFYCAVQLVSYVPVLVLIIYFLKDDLVRDLKNFKKDFGRHIAIVALGIIGMYIFGGVIGMIYQALGIEGSSVNENTINLLLGSRGKWLMIASVTLLAPIVEEVIFRKLLIDTFEVKFKCPAIVAIIISTLVFSFIHVSDLESLIFIFQYIGLALPICLAYHFSNNNIVVTFLIHIFNNVMSVLVVTVLWMI